MSVTLNYNIEIDNSTGANLFFRDTTVDYGTGGNIDYSDVRAVRMIMTNWYGQQNPVQLVEGDELEQYRQYIKTSVTTSVYDNKTLALSSFFIPFISGLTVLSGDTFETTGAFSIPITPNEYLPNNSHNVLNLSVLNWGLTETTFPNMIYGLQYEIYIPTDPTPLTTVVNETPYIVEGTTGTAIWNGNTYRLGEAFIASNNGAVSFTGDATLRVLEASVNKYFAIVWDAQKRLYMLKSEQSCGQKCGNDIMKQIKAELDTLVFGNYTQWLSITDGMKTINWIDEQLTLLERNA